MPLYRWDLDKSYIETDFESVRGLIRAATERPEQKKTVPGAPSLMRGLAQGEDSHISVLSGSPEQLRTKILARFQLDNIPISSLLLKDSVHRIKKRQFRDIKGQLGFKLQALLTSRLEFPNETHEVCFGDDVELDAIIYLMYSMCLSKTLDQGQIVQLMKVAKAYERDIQSAVAAYQKLPICPPLRGIFIRMTSRKSRSQIRDLGHQIIPVYSWSQAAFVLHHWGLLSRESVLEVLTDAKEHLPVHVANLLQDMIRMGFLDEDYIQHWPTVRPHYFELPKTGVQSQDIDFNQLIAAIQSWID
ncbi:MAG: phosphatase domain-containing protein [Myxococcota bacterium]